MPLGARKLQLRPDLRGDSAWQLLAEGAKDLVRSSAVSVDKYNEFVRWGSDPFKPGGLQEFFGHFHVEGPASRRDTDLNDRNVFGLQVGHKVRKRAPLGFARSNDNDAFALID
jgi:hypothetical protein